MTAEIRTLVGATFGGSNIPVQRSSFSNNFDWLKVKATASIGYDLVAVKHFIPEFTCTTFDLKSVADLFGNSIFKNNVDVNIYAGKIRETPLNGVFYDSAGILVLTLDDANVYLSRLSFNVEGAEPISCELKSRGTPIESSTTSFESFTITHQGLYAIANISVDSNSYGLRTFELNVTPQFYDYYEVSITPTLSALTGVDIEARVELPLADYLSLTQQLETECKDLILNLVKFRSCGLEPISGGTITLSNAIVKPTNINAELQQAATVELTIIPENITFSIS